MSTEIDEIAVKHAARLWNSSSCPAQAIIADAINDALDEAKLACLVGTCGAAACDHATCDALYIAANRIDQMKSEATHP